MKKGFFFTFSNMRFVLQGRNLFLNSQLPLYGALSFHFMKKREAQFFMSGENLLIKITHLILFSFFFKFGQTNTREEEEFLPILPCSFSLRDWFLLQQKMAKNLFACNNNLLQGTIKEQLNLNLGHPIVNPSLLGILIASSIVQTSDKAHCDYRKTTGKHKTAQSETQLLIPQNHLRRQRMNHKNTNISPKTHRWCIKDKHQGS